MSENEESNNRELSLSRGKAPAGRPSINYEFIDSQSPDTKSRIQRHTAHHAIQQRRQAAQQRLYREGSKIRLFEWQRRPSADAGQRISSPLSSTESPSPSPPLVAADENFPQISSDNTLVVSSGVTCPFPALSTSENRRTMYTDAEEKLLQFYSSTRCKRKSHAKYYERLIEKTRSDPATAYLLMAYAAAYRASTKPSQDRKDDDALVIEYKSRCISIMNSRLATSPLTQTSSDANIQAVIFLLAFENRYGSPQEASIHLHGLRRMVKQRGGFEAFESRPTIGQQLRLAEITGTAAMILDCGPDCNTDVVAAIEDGSLSLNDSITDFDESTLPDLATFFVEQLRIFRSEFHVRSLTGIFGPGHLRYQVFASALEEHPPRFSVAQRVNESEEGQEVYQSVGGIILEPVTPNLHRWSHLFRHVRLACFYFLNVILCTSASPGEAARLVDEIMNLSNEDHPTSESSFGLLWTFVYAMQLSHPANVDAVRLVLQLMKASRMLREPRLEAIESLMLHTMFYPLSVPAVSALLDESQLIRDIVDRS